MAQPTPLEIATQGYRDSCDLSRKNTHRDAWRSVWYYTMETQETFERLLKNLTVR